jgi:hypothetical protein
MSRRALRRALVLTGLAAVLTAALAASPLLYLGAGLVCLGCALAALAADTLRVSRVRRIRR